MSRVNLLPHEIKKGQQARRRTLLVLLGGLVLVVLVLLLWVVQGFRLAGVHDDIEGQNATNASLQREIDDLQQYEELQNRAQQQEELLSSAYANEVSYSGALADVSRVIPADTYLTSFTASSAIVGSGEGATGETTTTTTTTGVGTLSFTGSTLHFKSLSTWLTRLEEVEGWANPWTSNINQETSTPGAFTFDTSVDLSSDALTARGRGVIGG